MFINKFSLKQCLLLQNLRNANTVYIFFTNIFFPKQFFPLQTFPMLKALPFFDIPHHFKEFFTVFPLEPFYLQFHPSPLNKRVDKKLHEKAKS